MTPPGRPPSTPPPDQPAPPASRPEASASRRARPLLVGGFLAVAVATLLALFGDVREIGDELRAFDWRVAPAVLALTLWNYGWRFLKWQIYLQRLAITGLSTRRSLLIFLAGFGLSITPGKVGELVKSVYLRRFTGAPINRTSAIVAAERITDAVAMVLLAAVGLTQYAYGRAFVGLLALGLLAGVLLLQRPHLVIRHFERVAHRPLLGRLAGHGASFLDASATLYRPSVLARAVALGVVGWAGEGLAFYFVLTGLGLAAGPDLLLTATFILAVSSLAGGASMVPGGLGVTDAGVAGMLLLLVDDPGMSRSAAVAATLLIRFATLWFAVLLGALAMLRLAQIGAGSAVRRPILHKRARRAPGHRPVDGGRP